MRRGFLEGVVFFVLSFCGLYFCELSKGNWPEQGESLGQLNFADYKSMSAHFNDVLYRFCQ